jgi:hypothetical protein
MQEEHDTSELWCWNRNCSNYGEKGLENIVFEERYGEINSGTQNSFRTLQHGKFEQKLLIPRI